MTSGPFTVLEARPGDRWVLEGREDFPAGLGGPPLLDRLVLRQVSETAAQLAELTAGEAHVAVGVRADAVDRTDTTALRRIQRPLPRYTTVAWNGRRPPLDDLRVRQALGLAIDRDAIISGLRSGEGEAAASPVPPQHWAFDPAVRPLRHDPDAARRLLAAAGVHDRDSDGFRDTPDGDPFEITLLFPAGSDFNRDLGQLLQAQLREVGVRLELRAVDFAALVGIITAPERDFDAVLLALDTDPRIDLRSLFHSESMAGPFQLAGFRSSELDATLDSIEATSAQASALPLWHRAQQLIAEHQPWAFLYHGTETVLVRPSLQGVEADLRGVLWSAPEWWIRPVEGTD